MALVHVYPPLMPERRIALDAREELGPALLLHLVRASGPQLGLGTVLTRPWNRSEAWRLVSEGGGRLEIGQSQGVLPVGGLPCAGEAQVAIGSDPSLGAVARVVAAGASGGSQGVANGHAQAFASALAVVGARLDLRWVLADFQIRGASQPIDLSDIERSCGQAFGELAGKMSLRASPSSADRDRLTLCANLGGGPGQAGVVEALGDAIAGPRCGGRVVEVPAPCPVSAFRGQGQLAWLAEQTHAVGPQAKFVFEYDARDLHAARMVELAVSLLDAEGTSA
jgi:hypothetical protein